MNTLNAKTSQVRTLEEECSRMSAIQLHLEHAERAGVQLRAMNSRPSDVFVMRPFRGDTRWVYEECVQPACVRLGLKPIYLEDEVYAGKISEEIVRNLVECGILVADISDSNPNVMYEVGAAHVLGKAKHTILVRNTMEEMPFNVQEFRVLSYATDAEKASLARTLERVLRNIRDALLTDAGEEQLAETATERTIGAK